ncbi:MULTISPECIES: hypothetical protein [unclassified Streptomyces]|uniref:hypothetical protein n=1 Tax=unclassified Streptomyces TaxID=2593676 RepID=UPI0022566747|nr:MULTISPECIES: hypothetical protein [unclassified Streptomyces]MCX4881343.1 hypothetical protein [Streptomyces sp. NBC_00847]MCX5421393.1 hypothetical protein [Streptomyces sp. NBC_00078]
MSGDSVMQWGDGNIGIIKNQGAASPQAALVQLVEAALALREQVPASDRQVFDTSVEVLRAGGTQDRGRLRRALASIAGIAALVGEVGAPVVSAVNSLVEAAGLR